MSKTKAIVPVQKTLAIAQDPFARRALHIQRFHQLAMLHANQSVAAAILAGAELNHVKVALKKSATGCTFDAWLDENQGEIGFSRRTGFNYMRLASEIRKALPDDIAPLLDVAPSDLNVEQQKRLMTALVKKADSATLTELYLDYGIVKAPRKLRNHNPANNGSDDAPEVTVEEKVAGQLELFGRFTESLDEKAVIGGVKMLLITQWTPKQIDTAIEIAKRNLALLVKVKHGKAGK